VTATATDLALTVPPGAGRSQMVLEQWRREMLRRSFAPAAERSRHKPKRSPPRLDPVKSAAKMVAKNPDLIARIKDGVVEIVNKGTTPAIETDIELDATASDDVWKAIANIKDKDNGGSHGKH
jgi:hypothetical protein